MKRQEWSERTWVLLIQDASVKLVRSGYADTTLNRVGTSAGVTIEALTFRFSSKAALIEAVCTWGADVTRCARTVVDEVSDVPRSQDRLRLPA
ncbi:TetR family transcriptional regulator [Nocardiopsis sp. M1B1]|uniref:TetR family transcriptional regulator n=1 Tax=Nocardiopsis sp. M1B1 TaxID=3450454 RepID=UPI004039BFF5